MNDKAMMEKQEESRLNPGIPSVGVRKVVFAVIAVLASSFIIVSCVRVEEKPPTKVEKFVPVEERASQTIPQVEPTPSASATPDERIRIRFPHKNVYHSEVACSVCHHRDSNAARIGFPGRNNHSPCIGCHSQQFSDPASSYCFICHSDPASGGMKSFPPLSGFSAKFDHASHVRATACVVCHATAAGGVAKTIPSGPGTHATCFKCHSASSSPRMSSCGTCHEPGSPRGRLAEWRPAYDRSFSHAKHKLQCSACHKVLRGGKMSQPIVSMHLAPRNSVSCGACHDNVRAFGGDDFSDCKRCHLGDNDFRFKRQR